MPITVYSLFREMSPCFLDSVEGGLYCGGVLFGWLCGARLLPQTVLSVRLVAEREWHLPPVHVAHEELRPDLGIAIVGVADAHCAILSGR